MTDQEIRNALSVAPSPEFLARLRTRIASEPAPSAWRWTWTVAAVGALAAAVLVAFLAMPGREKAMVAPVMRTAEAGPTGPARHQVEPVPSAAVGNPGSSPLAPSPSRPGPGRSIASHVAGPKGRAPQRTATALPEILLDPAETRALRALVTGVREGRIDLTAAQRSVSSEPTALAPMSAIVIAPMTIDPLTPPGEQGVRQ